MTGKVALLAVVLATACSRSHASAPRTRITHAVVPFQSARASGSLHRFRIPLEGTRVQFVDLAYKTPLIQALDAFHLVINGGYWAYYGEARKIQGQLVVNSKVLAPRAQNLNGGILEIRGGKAQLFPSDKVIEPKGATLAIQCSPRLVVDSHIVPKLESKRLASRTALCIRDGGATLDAYLTADDTRTTLPELAEALLRDGCTAALNLDGGPSTAAVFMTAAEPLTVGLGEELPYGLSFIAE